MPRTERVRTHTAVVRKKFKWEPQHASKTQVPVPMPRQAEGTQGESLNTTDDTKMSRSERKEQKRAKWMDRLRVSRKAARQARTQDKPFLSLASELKRELVADSCEATSKPRAPPASKPEYHPIKSRRSRNQKLKQEATRFAAVLDHAAFQQDPFATVQQHLQNTL